MTKIIVHVGGGIVQDVFRVGKGRLDGVVVVDFDCDLGGEEENNTKAKNKDGESVEAHVTDYGLTTKLPRGSDVDALVKAWERNWKAKAKQAVKDAKQAVKEAKRKARYR